MELSTILSIVSILLTGAGMIWLGGFKFSALIHEVQTLRTDMDKGFDQVDKRFEQVDRRFEKIEAKIDDLRLDFHKIDIRVSILEKTKQ